MRRFLVIVIAWAVAAASACTAEPVVTLDVPKLEPASAASLIAPYTGHWTVSGQSWSDCPAHWRRAIPTGKTLWRQDGESLVIESASGAAPSAALWPADEQTLLRTTDVSFMGCTATESLTLIVESRGRHWASGFFSAELHHDGSQACLRLAQQAEVPSSCETTMTWLARR